MPRGDRLKLIAELEETRGSRVVCYLTSDRQGASGRVASDAIPWLYSHLRAIRRVDKLDLLLYSAGGLTMAGWRIPLLLREFCSTLAVLIPYRAHSAATLIALGADEIVMLPTAELSPVDPSTQSPFNPASPSGEPTLVPVEDVVGYISLAKEEADLASSEQLGIVFDRLAQQVHPLALGSVYRARQQIKMLAEKLLASHMPAESETIDKITGAVTQKLFSHDYPISRKEAAGMGLPVTEPPREEEGLIWRIYEDYQEELALLEPYSDEAELGDRDSADSELKLAIVESSLAEDVFLLRRRLSRVMISPPGQPTLTVPGVQGQIVSQGWRRETTTEQGG